MSSKKLSMLTYNVCFSRHQHFKRMEAISNLLAKYDPDIICLQEVRQDSLRLFLQAPWAKQYTPSRAFVGNNRHYGEVVFSKYPMIKTECFPFRRTLMTRHVNICDICIPVNTPDMLLGHNFTVVTAHLESMPENRNIRREQMMNIFDMMDNQAQKENVFFLGDTNFFSDEEFSAAELPQFWTDVWNDMAENNIIDRENTEFTYDSKKNKNTDGNHQSRIDRIFCKSLASEWIPSHYELVGTEPIEGTKLIYPSDHFGIYAEFSYDMGTNNDNEFDQDIMFQQPDTLKNIDDID